jgi:hypothetical protein
MQHLPNRIRNAAWATLSRIVIVALVVVVALTVLNHQPADAALGNQGTPVRCYTSGSLSAGTTQFMTCVSAAPPSFVSSQRVPAGYYFLVTDIFVTPLGGSTGSATVAFYLFDAYSTSGRASSYTYRSVDGQSSGQHFTTPLYVLTPDHRLEIQAFGANQQSFEIRITGLLVNNVTYLPITRNGS